MDPHAELVALLPQLRGFARSLVGGDTQLADDLVQDTALLALRAWDSFAPGTSLKSWLFKILHNRFHSLARRKHLSAEVASDRLDLLASAPPTQDSNLEVEAFRRAFLCLSPSQREVLVLSGVHGLPYEAIAEVCQCRVGTVKSRVSRARAQLKCMLVAELTETDAAPAAAAPAAAPPADVARPATRGRRHARPDPHPTRR